MTKLVKYTGKANFKRISADELAAAGITSPDIVFSQGQDYWKSVPDVIAVFLLADGDFKTYDGSSLLDVFEHNAAPEAAPEVLGVKLGTGGDTLDGVVVVPSGAADATPSLRALGTGAGEALPGNDGRVAGAIQKSAVTGTNKVFVRNDAGEIAGVDLDDGYVLVGSASGPTAISYAALEVLVSTGGIGLNLSDLADVDLTASVSGYYLAATPAGTKPFTLLPLPGTATGPGGESEGTVSARAGASYFAASASFDLTELDAETYIVEMPDPLDSTSVSLLIPWDPGQFFRIAFQSSFEPVLDYTIEFVAVNPETLSEETVTLAMVRSSADWFSKKVTFEVFPKADEGFGPDYWGVNVSNTESSGGLVREIEVDEKIAGFENRSTLYSSSATAVGVDLDPVSVEAALWLPALGSEASIVQRGAGAITVTPHASLTLEGDTATVSAGDRLNLVQVEETVWVGSLV